MDTKTSILNYAASIIREKGYFGTGMNEIIHEVKIPKGSLYHHFPGGKNEIITKALEKTAQEMSIEFKTAMKGKPKAEDGLAAVVDVFIDQAHSSSKPRFGCPLSTVALDVSDVDEDMRKTCERLFDYWINSIESYLVYKEVENAAKKAELFMVMLEGALLLSKARQNTIILEKIKQEIPSLINSNGKTS